ncbi:hypothetical protein HDK64DRAFT_252874 [Phyllosticta capitalensis]
MWSRCCFWPILLLHAEFKFLRTRNQLLDIRGCPVSHGRAQSASLPSSSPNPSPTATLVFKVDHAPQQHAAHPLQVLVVSRQVAKYPEIRGPLESWRRKLLSGNEFASGTSSKLLHGGDGELFEQVLKPPQVAAKQSEWCRYAENSALLGALSTGFARIRASHVGCICTGVSGG